MALVIESAVDMLGFEKIAPYNDNPLEGVLHMQLLLGPPPVGPEP